MFNEAHWHAANVNLVAKILSELHFEERLQFETDYEHEHDGGPHLSRSYLLVGAQQRWAFKAKKTIWGMLLIDPRSIEVNDQCVPLAAELLLDIQVLIGINDINLAGLLEEIQQTLYSDTVRWKQQQNVNATDLVLLDEASRQAYLDAHPKAIANKGRLGWGSDELAKYAPESAKGIQLSYLAIKKELCKVGFKQGLEQSTLLRDTLGEAALAALVKPLPSNWQDGFYIFAVHPWQYERFIQIQYAQYLAQGEAIYLGCITGDWLAQQSIRTLSSADQAQPYDLKTALTILNTSCFRGIPGQFIAQGPRLSSWLANLAVQDPLFRERGLHVQQEVAGVFCAHPQQQKIAAGAYRYNEMLGCIWRERAESLIPKHQRVMSMATLMQEDSNGEAAIVALISLSEISAEAWLRKLFKHVVVPLYHLMCRYGVALVAHGQNITLVLENHQPAGCTIKDFHGDLRLIDQAFPELESLDKEVADTLTRLPAHYLIHDLVTGHFVTVLRFVSPKLQRIAVSEQQFYRWLAEEICDYQASHPELKPRFELFDLFKPEIEKICVNRVRFKIGYGDSEERPLPEIGKPISNPLCC
ncbi:aerobactin siderophore biosynthesis protein IucC [Agarivorans sp. Toyoura001]|uniref:IucA/IucC family protein n=1 Tax=Agarivorans sp. Toyoura001 TaxID=2283141 RepID=UPI0010E02A05|nr:IucA/IucC family protein [Agarivorans sp. Toyoura001]GDY25890.1 aerobactin siderophore biosynthesis protein IucC [Agarivorans sp. Toyoura001]